MSRFRNLEFDESSGQEQRDTSRQQESLDEERCLAEARQAFERGRFEQALRAYSRALEYDPRCPEAWTGQVRMLVELSEYREAKLWADKGLETLPDFPEMLAAKAVALGRSGDVKAALIFSDAAVEEQGNTPYVWLARADVLLAAREKRAEYCLEKALALAACDWIHLWLAARVCSFHRSFSQALGFAQRALETAADRAVIWLEIGYAQRALGLAAPARNAFEQARQLDPQTVPPVNVLLAQAKKNRGPGWLSAWLRRFGL